MSNNLAKFSDYFFMVLFDCWEKWRSEGLLPLTTIVKNKTLAGVLIFSMLAQTSVATPFRIVGTRAVGMGGAHVAVGEGADAQYWNPAALGVTTGSGFQIPVGASFEATGDLLEKADAIVEAADAIEEIQQAQEGGATSLSLTQIESLTNSVNKILDLNTTGVGALVNANTGLQTRFGRVGVSFNQFADVGMLPIVDANFSLDAITGIGGSGITLSGDGVLNDGSLSSARNTLKDSIDMLNDELNLGLGDTSENVANKIINDALTSGKTSSEIESLISSVQTYTNELAPRISSSGGDLKNNKTRVNLTGAAMSEMSLGYGMPVMESPRWGKLALGANIKALRGQVGFARLYVVDGEDTELGDALDDARKTTKTSIKPSFDAGLLYRLPFKTRFQVGVLGRNINSPEFDTPDLRLTEGLGKYKEEAQFRSGVAIWPLQRWMLSADVDLTKNKSSIPGFQSQTWGAGTEFKIWLLDLRAGLTKNFEANTPLTYTGGLGLNFGALKISASGAVSSKTVKLETDGTEIPANAQASVTLGLVFGQGQGDQKKKTATSNDLPSSASSGISSHSEPQKNSDTQEQQIP